MDKKTLIKLIETAKKIRTPDLVIKNCKIVDVYSGKIIHGDIAISDKYIAGIGNYEGDNVIDADGKYATPGFIDSHIHIESSYVSPEELGKMIIPHGGTTIIADPHEIVNVCGIKGLEYMMQASKNTELKVKFMIPSCVPCTPFENSGAIIDSEDISKVIDRENVLGLGEFMNFPGVVSCDNEVIDKLIVAQNINKIIDGHCPGISTTNLNAYISAGITTDHECSTVEEMQERISRGMYILLREGSACHNLRPLLKGVTPQNSRRCLLCSDDRQPRTMIELGHLDNHLRICVEEGIDPIEAVRMATLNAAQCYNLKDRGGIAPGLVADIVLLDDLKNFNVRNVFIDGKEIARDGKYLNTISKTPIATVRGSMHVKDFSEEKLKTHLKSNRVNIIDIIPGGVVTKKSQDYINIDKNGEFIFNPEKDILKIAVIERHKNTGNIAVGFIRGYGLKHGAVALSIAHDSHNIIAVGVNDKEISFAVKSLIEQEGGIVLTKDEKVLESMPMPIAGLMSDKDGEWVDKKLKAIHKSAYDILKVNTDVEPVMTLCFMSLVVIPEIKITDKGLFDVMKFDFIPLETN